jgi:hypothetical protein
MRLYIKRPVIQGAWQWIQRGYKLAWEAAGFDAVYYDNLEEIKDAEFDLMVREWDIKTPVDLETLSRATRAYLFAQATTFPLPWGSHPNFRSSSAPELRELINKMPNVYLWSFGETFEYHEGWKKVHSLQLAFDTVSYKQVFDPRYTYDICYIGGRANNGFDEKYKIMLKYFGQFRHSKRKVGIFIGKNLSHEQENLILCSSKVCLNIHDSYQKTLVMTDTNERTFKSLGCNGALVSDREGFIPKHFPDVPIADTPEEMVELTEKYLTMPPKELKDIKEGHKEQISRNHTYLARTQEALAFKNFEENK